MITTNSYYFQEFLARKVREYGAKFDASDLAIQFTPFYESKRRVTVEFVNDAGEVTETKRGTIGITTGWRPCFLLMLRSNSRGSSHTLGKNDRVITTPKKIKRPKNLTLPANVVGELMQWVSGNRGSKSGNPYSVPQVREMLKAIAKARGIVDVDKNFYDAAQGLAPARIDSELERHEYAGYSDGSACYICGLTRENVQMHNPHPFGPNAPNTLGASRRMEAAKLRDGAK